jgi:hypothetical protein
MPCTFLPVQHFFSICNEYNLTGGKNIINASMLHIIEIKVEKLCFYSPDYKLTVERITLNKNNFLNHHYSILMHLATLYHTCILRIYMCGCPSVHIL